MMIRCFLVLVGVMGVPLLSQGLTVIDEEGRARTYISPQALAERAREDSLVQGASRKVVLRQVREAIALHGGAQALLSEAERGEPSAMYLASAAALCGESLPGWSLAPNEGFRTLATEQAGPYAALAAWQVYLSKTDLASSLARSSCLEAASKSTSHDPSSERWLWEAAISGLPHAQYELGTYYRKGLRGYPKLRAAATFLFARAASAGFTPAEAALQEIAATYLKDENIKEIRRALYSGRIEGLDAALSVGRQGGIIPADPDDLRHLSSLMERFNR